MLDSSAVAMPSLAAKIFHLVTVPGLKKILIIPDSGHWIQQERPTEVNAALLEFLRAA
jgi:pimeloyl-ACP methyl ester carboxylesterase